MVRMMSLSCAARVCARLHTAHTGRRRRAQPLHGVRAAYGGYGPILGDSQPRGALESIVEKCVFFGTKRGIKELIGCCDTTRF